MYLKDRCDEPFFWYRFNFCQISLSELWCTLQVLNHEISDLLDDHVISSSGTLLFVRKDADLMNPFLKPCSNPNKIQKYTSKGITIFQLWRKIWQVKKMHLYSWKNASQFSERRRNFIRVGSFKTTEIFFAAATNHLLAKFAHFKGLGPKNSSFYKSGTKTTETIISHLKGKAPQNQSYMHSQLRVTYQIGFPVFSLTSLLKIRFVKFSRERKDCSAI